MIIMERKVSLDGEIMATTHLLNNILWLVQQYTILVSNMIQMEDKIKYNKTLYMFYKILSFIMSKMALKICHNVL